MKTSGQIHVKELVVLFAVLALAGYLQPRVAVMQFDFHVNIPWSWLFHNVAPGFLAGIVSTRIYRKPVIRRAMWHAVHRFDGYKWSSPVNRALLNAVNEADCNNVEVCLKRGADPNQRMSTDMPLLVATAVRGYCTIAKLLLEAGANANARDRVSSFTALHCAAYKGHSEVVSILLQRGADINASDCNGNDALMLALVYKKEDAAKTLLANGANPDHKNHRGATANSIAKKRAYKGIYSLLEPKAIDIEAPQTVS